MTFHGLAIWMNYNGPSGEGIQACYPKTETTRPRRSVAGHPETSPEGTAGVLLLHATRDMDQITVESRYKSQGLVVLHGSQS